MSNGKDDEYYFHSDSLIFRETEDELINIGKWAILSVRLPGYFPLQVISSSATATTSQNSKVSLDKRIGITDLKELQSLQKKSPYYIYILIWCTIGSILTLFGIWSGYDAITRLELETDVKKEVTGESVFSEVGDKFISTYNGASMLIISTYFRLHFISFPKRSLMFWKKTAKLLQKFESLGNFSESEHFQTIKNETKQLTVCLSVTTIIQTIFALTYLYYKRYSIHNFSVFDFKQGITSIIWFFSIILIHCHIMFITWLTFFIKIYSCCFKVISILIQEIAFKENYTVANDGLVSDFKLTHLMSEKEKIIGNDKQHSILELINLFESTCVGIEKFNHFYALPLIIEVYACISNSVTGIYFLNKLVYEMNEHSWVLNCLIALRVPAHLAFLIRVVYLTSQSSCVTQEGLRVLKQLQKLPISILYGDDTELLTKMQMLVSRVSLNPPGISPGNFFTLSKAFLLSMVSILGTYYVVLSEFREESEGLNIIRNLTISCFN